MSHVGQEGRSAVHALAEVLGFVLAQGVSENGIKNLRKIADEVGLG